MRTTQDYEVPRRYEGPQADPPGTGWVSFAAILLGLAGCWNFFAGVAAIANAHVYVGDAHYVFSDLKTWGWIILVLGVLQAVAAMALLSGSEIARWFGIAVAAVNSIGQLMFIPAYPLWGVAMFGVDMLIIYGLAVYGGKRLKAL